VSKSLIVLILALSALSLAGCLTTGSGGPSGDLSGGASAEANAQADKTMYKPVVYVNASIPGPELVVLPGEMKAGDASFAQKITLDNVADCAEHELSKANFKVLERSDLGGLLKELELAANLGDPAEMAKYKAGKFKSAKWFVKFDILKAEPVARSEKAFDGQTAGALLSFVPGVGGAIASTVASSAKSAESAGVWVIGMRYKIIDACTCEQIASDYFEEKMEIGAKGASFMGITQTQQSNVTLDSMVQRLTQLAVADIDQKWKSWTPPATEQPVKEKQYKKKKPAQTVGQ